MRIQITKRAEITKKHNIIIKLIAILAAIIIVGIYLAALGYQPFGVYGAMVEGSLLSVYDFQKTIVRAIPILICGLGLGIAFKMNFWNIGAEGQMLLGGFGAALVGLNFTFLPAPLLLLAMAVSGMFFGGLWAFIPGVFNVQWKTNETIVTLMMNYVAVKFITYLQYGPWKDPNAKGFPKIAGFEKNAILPSVFGINIGWIIALLLVVLINVYMNRSKLGFESAVIGESRGTARYAGINIKKTMLISVFISGALCGLAGMIQTSAVSKTLNYSITSNAGNIAIIVAWLCNLKPSIMIIVSVLFAALLAGGEYIQIAYEIPAALAEIIQATVLFCVLGSAFFSKYKIRLRKTIK